MRASRSGKNDDESEKYLLPDCKIAKPSQGEASLVKAIKPSIAQALVVQVVQEKERERDIESHTDFKDKRH